MRSIALLLLTFLLAGCASARPEEAVFTIPAGQFQATFAAAKDVLVAYRFDLDRVDARTGVLTTQAKPSSGLATPWDAEQSTLLQEWEDLLNRQLRRVRVTFEPAEAVEPAPPDLRLFEGPLVARVEVVIYRRQRPGWRVETTSIRMSSFTRDPSLRTRRMAPSYDVPHTRDELLAARLGREIARRAAPDA